MIDVSRLHLPQLDRRASLPTTFVVLASLPLTFPLLRHLRSGPSISSPSDIYSPSTSLFNKGEKKEDVTERV